MLRLPFLAFALALACAAAPVLGVPGGEIGTLPTGRYICERPGDITGLVAGLLGLAGAAATGQAAPILAALDKIHTHVKDIKTHQAPKPA